MGWLRNFRRRRLLRRPFPPGWIPILQRRMRFYPHFADDARERFHDMLKLFVWEKHFIGAGGLEIDDEIRVVIGAAAVRLVVQLDISYYDRLTEIVVYPHHFQNPKQADTTMLGEAHQWGTVVLSWPAVLHGLKYPCDGHDTALHEFAHVLDRATGRFDGTPDLRASEHYRPWAMAMSRHFLELQNGAEPQRVVLRGYGGKNEAEFFAVATESFFEKPLQMKELTPDLYQELRRFYGVDPVTDPTCGLG